MSDDSKQRDDRAGFAECLAHVLDLATEQVPVPAGPDPFIGWRGWLAGRGLGLVPIAGPGEFSWPACWIASVRDQGGSAAHWVVMFGVPPGVLFDPNGPPAGDPGAIDAGYAVAALELVPGRMPGGEPLREGRVEAIYIAADARAGMQPVAEAQAGPEGLLGDRYFAGAGTFSNPDAIGMALTLIEAEALEEELLPDGERLRPEEARRNLVTRGISLNDLVGRRFQVGEIECLGRRLCEPCAHLQRLTRAGVLRSFVHRGGLRADILSAGVIRVGDTVTAGTPPSEQSI